MRNVYLLLAVIGAIVPFCFFLSFFQDPASAATGGFVSALFVNGAAGGFTVDLLISSLVFWLWMWTRRDSGPAAWPFVIVNLLIGLSCALPAYLYFSTGRDRPPA